MGGHGGGCAAPRYLQPRSLRDNPLAGPLNLAAWKGPTVSERSTRTLRRYGLLDQHRDDADVCLHHLTRQLARTPTSDLAYTLSEVAYVQGKRADNAGHNGGAMHHYGVALMSSYRYLFDPTLGGDPNPYDPQFRDVCDLYNESLEDLLRLLCAENRLRPGQTYTIRTGGREFIIETQMRGRWNEEEFERYEFVSDFDIKELRNRHTTYGLGVPLVAVRKPDHEKDPRRKYYPDGLSYAVTALLRCPEVPLATPYAASVGPGAGSATGSAAGLAGRSGPLRMAGTPSMIRPVGHQEPVDDAQSPRCILEFYDPLAANQVQLGGRWVPLETDLTTPLAYFLDSPEYRRQDSPTAGLFTPEDVQPHRGLYMLEPYDPDRIPVLMVHGLWSSPMTWMDMFNDLRSFPELRERYQFWFYLYPSGNRFGCRRRSCGATC